MTTSTRTLVTGLIAAGATAAISIAGAGAATAQQGGTYSLSPGATVCSTMSGQYGAPGQYAFYQVRADGKATKKGASFTLRRDGVVVSAISNQVNAWAAEFRTAHGNFPGSGSYLLCAQNTGNAVTVVTLQLRTDAEF